MSNYSNEKRYQKDGEKRYQKDGEKRYQKDGEKRYQKDGEKNCVDRSRRYNYDGEITKCTAAAKGKCNRKNCKFAPCCYKNGTVAHREERSEREEEYYYENAYYYAPDEDYAMTRDTSHTIPYNIIPEEHTNVMIAWATDMYNKFNNVTATTYVAPTTTYVAPAPVAPAPVAPAPVAPEPVSTSFKFNRNQYNLFTKVYDINCRDLKKLTEVFPDFSEYIADNQACFNANLNQFIDVINGSVPVTSAAIWIQEIFKRGYLNIDSFKGGKCNEADIRNVVNFGIYNVFKTYHTNDDIDDNTFVGLVLCDFACRYVIQNNTNIQLLSFEDINSKITSEVYRNIY